MTEPRLNILILGGSDKGKALLELFNRSEGIKLLGVIDEDSNAPGIKLARELGIPAITSYKELPQDNAIDYIINTTERDETLEQITGLAHASASKTGRPNPS